MTEAAQKKGGVLGFLKTIGVVEETPDVPVRNTPVPAAPRNTPVPPVPLYGSAPPPPVSRPDPEALGRLEKRLQTNCPPAYAAFMEQYNLLKEDIPDERTRFKVALKTTHTTSEQVAAALDQLFQVMNGAREEFHHAFDENKSKKTSEAEASVKATQELIASSEEQIRAIQDKIVSLRAKLKTDTETLQGETQRLDQICASFEASWAQVYAGLQTQKSRIDSMGKA